ncbi:MAG: type II toxin-antitoxin system RelE/ParE family toxin [Nanoarchaeales archaeon]|nr:type II toxin-antitoxin system RelE/ParE family toxin [Nanoarchaeales archaeon]
MNKVIWTELAESNFDNILFYLSQNSESYLEIFKTKFDSTIDKLLLFPNMGKDFKEVKEYPFENYRIIYDIFENNLILISITHSRRNF